MITDALVAFIPIGAPLSLVGGSGITFRSGIVDLLGQGVGTAPANIIGNRTIFGTDLGIGGKRPELNVTIGTALAAAAGTTLKAALQIAQDQGAGGNYQPGAWQDLISQDGITLTQGAAGAVILRVPWIPQLPAGFGARYMSLLFSPQLASITPNGDFTAGTIASALVTNVRDDQANKFAAGNFTVA